MPKLKKEIIIVTLTLGNDGAERVLTELANEWVRGGHKVSVIQTNANGYGCSYNLAKEVEVINIKAKSKIKILRYLQEINLLKKILKKRPNAIVISFIVASIFILAMCKFFVGNKIIVSERNNPKECPAGKLQQKLRDLAFCLADACVFQTEEVKNMFPSIAKKKGYIIPNPINSNLPEPYNGERRKVIVTACRLHPQKNLPMMIKAFKMLHEEYPDYTLEIYGQGRERENLEKLIKDLGLQNSVLMPGFADDIHRKMVDASMFVSSSDYEGISNSMLEALGMGIPTVVTDCPIGGARLMINNNINGVLVPVGDTKKLYIAMKKVLIDKEFSTYISQNAVRIKTEYPISKISQMWLSLI